MSFKIIAGIYKIESPSGKIYIGQSYNIYDRWNMHRWYAKKGFDYFIYRSFHKYGIDSHKFTVVHELPIDVSNEVITRYEQIYMDAYRECGSIMLNMTTAAGTTKGRKHTDEARKKMSKRKKENPNWKKGILRAIETNKGNKYSLGHRHSEETKKKMSEAHRGNKSAIGRPAWNKGKSFSEETKKKMSEAAKKRIRYSGYHHSLEARKKMSESAKGRFVSEETKEKMASFHRGRMRSTETKRKMRESWIKRKAHIVINLK